MISLVDWPKHVESFFFPSAANLANGASQEPRQGISSNVRTWRMLQYQEHTKYEANCKIYTSGCYFSILHSVGQQGRLLGCLGTKSLKLEQNHGPKQQIFARRLAVNLKHFLRQEQ